MAEIKDFLKAFNDGKGFEFMMERGNDLSKTDLIYITRELIYGIESSGLLPCEIRDVRRVVNENLEE